MNKITITVNREYGSGGWIEGVEKVKETYYQFTSKSTGKTVRIPESVIDNNGGVCTAYNIRHAIERGNSKDLKITFCGMKNTEIIEDFGLESPEQNAKEVSNEKRNKI